MAIDQVWIARPKPQNVGRYTGIVATRSIAEAVFTSQLLTDIRTHNLDIDSIAEYLHQQSGQPVANKTTEAKTFMTPLIAKLTEFLQTLTPPAGEGTALRRLQQQTDKLHQQESELQRARDKLRTHGIGLTPTKPSSTTPPPAATTLPLTAPTSYPPTSLAILNLTSQTLQNNYPAKFAQASRSGSKHCHLQHKPKPTTSSRSFVTNASQKNSSKKRQQDTDCHKLPPKAL